jgi:hypothetical protein
MLFYVVFSSSLMSSQKEISRAMWMNICKQTKKKYILFESVCDYYINYHLKGFKRCHLENKQNLYDKFIKIYETNMQCCVCI